ncbi:MAG: Disaggregatase related repeat, partial [Actinomycetota bacterium]|nr:Disaggregatase related repeat [Actinomycetota bacterium]
MLQIRYVRRAIPVLAFLLIPLGAVPGPPPLGAATHTSATTTATVTAAVDTFVAGRSSGNDFTGYGQYDIPLANFVVNAGYTQQPVTTTEVAGTFRGLQKFDFSQFAGREIVKAVWHGDALAVTGTKPVVLALLPISTEWEQWSVSWANQPGVRAFQRYSKGFTHPGWRTADITTYVANYASGLWVNHGLELRVPSRDGLVQ